MEKREQLAAQVGEGEFDGYIHLTTEAVEQGRVNYYVPDSRSQNTMVLGEGVRTVVTLYRMEKMGLTAAQITLPQCR